MGILPNLDDVKGPETEETLNSNGSKKKYPPAEYWLNVGVIRGDVMLQLPQGIPLDNLKAKEVPKLNLSPDLTPEQVAKKKKFRAQRVAEQQLWDMFRSIYLSLKPGEERDVALVCRLRRTNAKENNELEETEENPYSLGDLKL